MLSNTSPARRSSRAKRSGANSAPVTFDSATHPIISLHWFGVEPTTVEAPASLRRHRQFEHIHRLGPRAAVMEFDLEVFHPDAEALARREALDG